MQDGGKDRWPYNIEWLNDAYPVPYWARKQQEQDAKAAAAAPVGATK